MAYIPFGFTPHANVITVRICNAVTGVLTLSLSTLAHPTKMLAGSPDGPIRFCARPDRRTYPYLHLGAGAETQCHFFDRSLPRM